MIAATETMVIVGSPDLAASKVCAEEIAHARNLGKAHYPGAVPADRLRCRAAAAQGAELQDRFTGEGGAAFAAALDALCKALDTDVAWHHEAARQPISVPA
jgi:hypothetical protein